jgi:hypothetical protein
VGKRSLIIGAATGYNYNQLKPWIESINECGFDGDKVLVLGESSKETRQKIVEQGFTIVDMLKTNAPIHVARFLTLYDYLKDHWEEYEYVITTDVRDVYFQTNPVDWLKKNVVNTFRGKTLVAGSESIRYKDESWGDQNLMETYGPYVYELFKDNIIYNVGTLGGTAEHIKDLVFNIYTNAINRPISIVDQAVFNVLIQTQPYKDSIVFADQKDGWACQAGTTVDPSKIERFRPFLTEDEPLFEDGIVKTSLGEPFCIVHQYDRVPEWKKFVERKYNQYDENDYFTVRT